MIVCSLPGDLCSQRYFFRNEFGLREVAVGLRQDMKEWIADYCPNKRVYYNLVYENIDFVFPTRGLAALFVLYWSQQESIVEDPPMPRPESSTR